MSQLNRLHSIIGAAAFALALSACGPVEPSIDEICKNRLPGDLVISEFMNDPSGTDTGKEYVELYNATGTELELKGLTLVHGATDGTGDPKEYVINSARVPAGGYFVLGDSRAEPRPVYENQSYGDKLGGLRNTNGLLQIRCGTKVLDEVKYATPAGTGGKSNELDGKLVPDSAVNDVPGNFCAAATSIDGTNFGTPGKPNGRCGVAGTGSCIDGTTGQTRAPVLPGPGELVITEFMPDPSVVADTEGEWIEVTAPSRTVDLNGLVIESGASKSTLASESCLTLGTGAFAVLARKDDPAVNGGLPAVTALVSVSMSNSGGTLTIKNGNLIVDQIAWNSSTSGAASQLNPDMFDASANDDPLAYCAAQKPYGQGDLGTPGEANAACPPVVVAGQCFDSDLGGVRSIVTPAVGDLVITELMQNPAGTDSLGEWVEVTALKDVDLNGLRIEAKSSTATNFSGTDLSSTECLRVAAGGFALFASNIDSATNGGLPFVTTKVSFSLTNTSGTVRLMDGANVLDEVTWTSVTDSASTQLDVDKYDPTLNDDPANRCVGLIPYGDGANKGSPGSDNHGCGSDTAPKCFDPVSQTVRDVVLPQVGDLVITELHQNPKATADTDGEFFEVQVNANVELNGLQIANEGTGNTTLKGTDCISATAGSTLVFGRKTDPVVNGGLPTVTATFNFGLGNYGTVALPKTLSLRRGTFEIDKVSWTSSTDGASTQLSSDKLDPTLNDDPANFCPTAEGTTYGAGDRGTPGVANAVCQ